MVQCDLYVYYKRAPYVQVALHKRHNNCMAVERFHERHHTSLRKVQDLTEKPNGQSNPQNMVIFFSKVTVVILYINMCKTNILACYYLWRGTCFQAMCIKPHCDSNSKDLTDLISRLSRGFFSPPLHVATHPVVPELWLRFPHGPPCGNG